MSPLQFFFINTANTWKCSYNAKCISFFALAWKQEVFCWAKDCGTQGKQFCKIRCIILLVDNNIKEQLWIQSTRLLHFNLHLQYNTSDCYIVRGLVVAPSHLLAEKKTQFVENSLVVCFFFSSQCFACEKHKLGKGVRRWKNMMIKSCFDQIRDKNSHKVIAK